MPETLGWALGRGGQASVPNVMKSRAWKDFRWRLFRNQGLLEENHCGRLRATGGLLGMEMWKKPGLRKGILASQQLWPSRKGSLHSALG